MPSELPKIDYHRPSPDPDRWQLRYVIELLMVSCFVAAVLSAGMSFFVSRKLAKPTPAYVQFLQSSRAQAATRPAGVAFEYPVFTGRAYEPLPLLTLPTTYLSLGFAGAGIALLVLTIRRSRLRIS